MKDAISVDKARPFVYNRDVQRATAVESDSVATTFYTAQEVADLIRVSRQTIYRALASGALQGINLGNAGYRITDAQLQAYLDRSLTKAGPNGS